MLRVVVVSIIAAPFLSGVVMLTRNWQMPREPRILETPAEYQSASLFEGEGSTTFGRLISYTCLRNESLASEPQTAESVQPVLSRSNGRSFCAVGSVEQVWLRAREGT
jgi:hypothetical protein